jgi:hypothetical protein
MLLPKHRRNGTSVRRQGFRSIRRDHHYRPQVERLEDRLVLNYSFGATPIQWVELNGASGAMTVINNADDAAAAINLGSNSINFYGTTYTGPNSLFASSNGLITFGSGNTAFMNGDLKSSPTQAAISPFWDDYIKSLANANLTGPMVLSKIDTANNCLIIEWNHVNDMTTSPIPVTFETIIQLNTGSTPGNITFNFLQLDVGKGISASVGIKAAGVQGPNNVVVSFNVINPLVDNNTAILFQWQSPVQIPVISSLGTTSTAEQSPDLTFTVNGSNFANTSFVQFGGTALTTTFINTGLLQATIPASLLAEERSFNVTVVTPGSSGGTSNAVPFMVTDAPLTPSGQLLSSTAGQTLTNALVATFTDPGTDGTTADYSATVTWDDGNGKSHSVNGTVQLISGDSFGVYADNTVPYAREGVYGVTVVIADLGGSQATVTSEVSVADGPLSGTGINFSATEEAAFSGLVARFSDADPNGALSDFTATIAWGDGQTSSGIIAAAAGGGFQVSGRHTYAEDGNYQVSVTIADVGGASLTTTGLAGVGDAPLTAQGTNISATEGLAFSGSVATFTDDNPNSPLGDFSATINWGDGSSSAGAVATAVGGGFMVSGSHTYADEGNYSVSVFISDVGGASITANGSAGVADASLAAQGTSISATEGIAFSGNVASFTDGNPNSSAGDFTATINWGDGQSSSGTVGAGTGGGFVVSGSHTYADEGNHTVSVSITDVGGNSTSASGSASVADAALTAQGINITGTEGAAFSGNVASFIDANPNGAVGDFTATINWGDGQSSSGTLGAGTGGGFVVSGSHTYADEGNYTVSVSITDVGGSSATASGSASIGDASLTAQGTSISGTEGAAFSGTVASFTDANPNGALGDFTATINWGDGQTSSGLIAAGPNGSFLVSGGHVYGDDGNYSVSVQISDFGGATITATSSATIGDAALSAQGTTITATQGVTFSGVVATFTDANVGSPLSDFSATIAWGDGSSSTGTIQIDPNGGFDVVGSHAYSAAGTDAIAIQISDVGGSSAAANSTTQVAPADPSSITAFGTSFKAFPDQSFTAVVATFSDSNLNFTVNNFTAVIDWGDGSSSAGMVYSDGSGGFYVNGTHTYQNNGAKKVVVTIQDSANATAQANTKIVVSNGGVTTPLTARATVRHSKHHPHATLTGSFSDITSNLHKVLVSWGDGTISELNLGISSAGTFSLDHDYSLDFLDKHCGRAHIHFAVLNQEGASSLPQVFNVNFNTGHHHFSEGHNAHHHGENDSLWDIPGFDFF